MEAAAPMQQGMVIPNKSFFIGAMGIPLSWNELVFPSSEECVDEKLAKIKGENATVMLVYVVPGVSEAAAAATVAVVGGYAVYKAGSYLYERAKNWYEARRSSKKKE